MEVRDTVPRLVGVELFSGAGGLTLGLEQAGIDVKVAVEYDPIHAATHEYNFPETDMVCADVRNVNGAELRERAGGAVDLLAGGPSCQGFSTIGKRQVDDPRNSLVLEFGRLVIESRARYLLMENVPGMLIGEQRHVLDALRSMLADAGYETLDPVLVRAVDEGVPQQRVRLFLLGARRGERLPELPALRTPGGLDCPTVGDALDDLPDCDTFPELLERDWVETPLGVPSDYAAAMRGLVRDADDYSCARPAVADLLTDSLRTLHTADVVERFAATPLGAREPISHFRRLDPKGFCDTLRAGGDVAHGSHTAPRPIHPYVPRSITNREAARLHSLPDWFRLHASKLHGFRQVGNAVPPRLGRALGAAIREAAGGAAVVPHGVALLGDEALLRLSPTEAAARYGVAPDVVGRRIRRSRVA